MCTKNYQCHRGKTQPETHSCIMKNNWFLWIHIFIVYKKNCVFLNFMVISFAITGANMELYFIDTWNSWIDSPHVNHENKYNKLTVVNIP